MTGNICVFVMAVAVGAAAVSDARADTRTHWRYAGGAPSFVGSASGGLCPLPSNEKVVQLQRKGYDVGYAPRLGLCLWVAYSLTPADVTNMVGRVGDFRRDADLWNSVVPPESYWGSGYDRGHMAPSQDMQYDYDVSRQSFFMANIVPQTPRMNRGAWKQLEGRIHRLVVPYDEEGNTMSERVFVMTGPVFDKASLALFEAEKMKWEKDGRRGPSPMPKPIACWKIYKHGATAIAAIIDQGGNAYSTTPKHISRLTGLSFFRAMPAGLKLHYDNLCRNIYPNQSTTEEEE